MAKTNWINNVHVEGYVFNHTLQQRVAQRTGITYISGEINVATDNKAMNVVPVRFIYVTEKYSQSKQDNPNYAVLTQIMNDNRTFEAVGTSAMKVRIDGSIYVDDFFTAAGQLASPKRIQASFIHFMNDGQEIAAQPTKFETEMLIENVEYKENNNGDYLDVKGYVFNFRGDILPVSFSARSAQAIKYFQAQDYPMLTKVWGKIDSTTIERKVEVESAFGDPAVNVTTQTLRFWEITGASPAPMEYPSDGILTDDEVVAKLAERNDRLNDLMHRWEENKAAKANPFGGNVVKPVASNASPTSPYDFKF